MATGENDKTGLIATVLGYIDRPWKAAVIIVLFVVGGAGWVLYEKRDELIESWLTPNSTELRVADVPAALEKLVEESGADLIQIWAVDLGANSQRFIAARRSDGERPVIPSPRRLPIIVSTTDVQALVNVLNGHPACGDTASRDAPLMERLTARGMKWICGIPIPPSSEAFVGIIYLAWYDQPTTGNADIAKAAATEISKNLTKR